jgi:predicted Fe-Mo cluster-binding NifX family protein
MKIAIPSNDGINIFTKMLGMAKYMYIYETENGDRFKLVEKRNNPYEKTMQHLKTLDVYNLIDDCSIILSAYIGEKGVKRLEKRGVKMFFSKGNIVEALNKIKQNPQFLKTYKKWR